MFRIPFESIQINDVPFNIVDNSLQLSFRAGGKTIRLSGGPSGGDMFISRQKLSRLQQALKTTTNQSLRIIIANTGDSEHNFTDGTSEFQLSGNLKSASNLKRSSTRSLKRLLAAVSQETLSLLDDPVLEPDQLVPVIKPPKPDPSPSPSPQPAPAPKPSDGGDGGNSRTFLLSVNSANSELAFGGTATGQIRLTGPAGSTSTFTREGLTQTASITPLNTYTIILSTASNDLDGSTYTSGIKVAGSITGDLVRGSLQADSIAAGDGSDTITGGDGNDTIVGGIGNDSIIGNQGDDSILAGDGNDIVVSGQGNDLIEGGDGDDELYGGSTGDDTIHGGAGADLIDGQDGADLITGGDGADNLVGGDGNDSFLYTNEAQLVAGSSLVDSVINGGANTDRISVANGLNIVNTLSFANATSIEELYVTGTAASSIALDLTAQTAGINTVNISTATANSTVDVTEFTATGVNITGGAANDNLTGGGGADTISGEDGTDTITGGNGDDIIVGGAAADNLSGGVGENVFRYGTGEFIALETVTGGSGADTILFSADAQTITDAEFTNKTLIEAITTANGSNSITLGTNAAAATSALTVTGGLGADTINASAFGESVTIVGNAGANVLTGSNQDDTITGGADADTITGGNGADTLTGNAGDNRFVFNGAVGSTDIGNNITDFGLGGTNNEIDFVTNAAAGSGADGDFGGIALANSAGVVRMLDGFSFVTAVNGNDADSLAVGDVANFLANVDGQSNSIFLFRAPSQVGYIAVTDGLNLGIYLAAENTGIVIRAGSLTLIATLNGVTTISAADLVDFV